MKTEITIKGGKLERTFLQGGRKLVWFAAWTAGLSLVFGLAWGLTRTLQNLLYGVAAGDPITFGAVTALLGVIGLAACYVPARRAARLDPIAVLRAD